MATRTCFAIMPFKPKFDDISREIGKAASALGLEYKRGDQRGTPGRIMPQIMADIRRAAVVVADITDLNPNVFYELSIAHQIKAPGQVVILAQQDDVDKFPYDVHEFRVLTYTHSSPGLRKLRRELPTFIQAAAASADRDQDTWDVVRGRLPRTRLLVKDLRRLLDDAGSKKLHKVTIRIAASLSTVAISDHEPADDDLGSEYLEALVAERDALRAVLVAGARLKVVLNPPRRLAGASLPERLRVRFKRLIGLLESPSRSDIVGDSSASAADLLAIKRCQIVLSPVPMQNLFILGNSIAYEGIKRGAAGGFEITHCERPGDGLQNLIDEFDHFFENSRDEMISAYPPDGQVAKQLRDLYRHATARNPGETNAVSRVRVSGAQPRRQPLRRA